MRNIIKKYGKLHIYDICHEARYVCHLKLFVLIGNRIETINSSISIHYEVFYDAFQTGRSSDFTNRLIFDMRENIRTNFHTNIITCISEETYLFLKKEIFNSKDMELS